MRLPPFLTRLSPIRETLEAIQAGETELSALVQQEHDRLAVDTADSQGLALWEADYGLPDGSGLPRNTRRDKIHMALAGACTITPGYLKDLCATLSGVDDVELEEAFQDWRVEVRPVARDAPPVDGPGVEGALRPLMPAHLALEVTPCAQLRGDCRTSAVPSAGVVAQFSHPQPPLETGHRLTRKAVPSAGALAEFRNDQLPLDLGHAMARAALCSGGLLAEVWG